MKNNKIHLNKKKIIKKFSVCLFLYAWFIFSVFYDNRLILIEKIFWTEVLILLCCFSFETIVIIEKTEMMLNGPTKKNI